MPLYIKNADSEVNLEVFKVFFFTVKTQSRSILQTEYSVYTCTCRLHGRYTFYRGLFKSLFNVLK